jgi:hypothetical protein
VAAEVREGRGESLLGDDRRDHIGGTEECGYEQYVGYYLHLMSKDILSLHYRCTPSRTKHIKILSSCWAFHGVPGVYRIFIRGKSLIERWCRESQSWCANPGCGVDRIDTTGTTCKSVVLAPDLASGLGLPSNVGVGHSRPWVTGNATIRLWFRRWSRSWGRSRCKSGLRCGSGCRGRGRGRSRG